VKKFTSIAILKAGLLLVPAYLLLQQFMGIHKVEKLKGAIKEESAPVFTIENWFSEEFQNQFEKYNNQNFGFRSTAVRLANQFKYSFFGEFTNAEVRQYGNNLITTEYLDSYLGGNRITISQIKERCGQLKNLADYMEQQGKASLVIIAPDKTSYYQSDYNLPPESELDSNNYKNWLYYLTKYEIPFLDFRKAFLSAKQSSSVPLFSNQGIHWNTYGAQFALDSVAAYLNSNYSFKGPRMQVDSLVYSKNYDEVEYDIESSLNLMFRLPRQKLAYQANTFTVGKRPKLLMISDSFFFQLYTSGFANKLFDDPLFYYYHIRALKYSEIDYAEDPNANSLKEILKETDVVCLMAVDINLKDFPWAFGKRFEVEVLGDSLP
jgi:hypothetical protein